MGDPFGLGIVFFLLFFAAPLESITKTAMGCYRRGSGALRRLHYLPGRASTGMLREGLHAWVLTLIVVVAAQQQCAGFARLRSATVRELLTLRPG